MSEISVIYDGKCELCNNSINWLKKKIEITALDFHSADLPQFGLSLQQCSREVFVITGNKTTAKIATIRLMGLSLTIALLGCLGEITN